MMRNPEEIAQAYDVIASLLQLTLEVGKERAPEKMQSDLIVMADILAWCLGMPAGEEFGNVLQSMERCLRDAGYEVVAAEPQDGRL